MGISEQDFKREMNNASSLSRIFDEDKDYWIYFQKGLQKLYHGEAFESASIHEFRCRMAESKNEKTAKRGRGYLAGFSYRPGRGGNPVGRKQVGDTRLSGPKVWAQEKKELMELCVLIGEHPSDYMRRVIMNAVHNDMRRFKKE